MTETGLAARALAGFVPPADLDGNTLSLTQFGPAASG